MNPKVSSSIPPLVLLCVCTLLASPCAADQDTPQANNPVSLADAPASAQQPESADAPTSETPSSRPAANTPEAEAGTSPMARTGSGTADDASGGRKLGAPGSLFSLGESSSADGGAAEDLLVRLDPRTNEFTRVFAALVLVLGLILSLRVFIRRAAGGLAGGGRPSGVLEVLARYPVAKGQHLVLLKLGRRVVLAHQSAGAMSTLTEITAPDEVAALMARIEAGAGSKATGRPGAFNLMLRRFESNHERSDGERAFRDWLDHGGDGDVIDLTRAPRRRTGRKAS